MANVALLATVADSKASQRAGGASALMPSGIILPFAGSTSPTGWIVCDGAAYSQTDYPELFGALGSSYNTQVNPTTGAAYAAPSAGQFRVPDMRGLFLRGEGTASGGDAVSVGGHQVGKTAKNGMGSSVSGTDGTHNHTITDSGHKHTQLDNVGLDNGANRITGYGASLSFGTVNAQLATYATGTGIAINTTNSGHGHTVSVAGDNETRPTNRGVRYIIKA